MKSLFILLFFLIIIWLTYNYSYNKYYTDKIERKISNILLPLSIDDQFKHVSLLNSYNDMFNKSSININYVQSGNETTSKTINLQRYFTEF